MRIEETLNEQGKTVWMYDDRECLIEQISYDLSGKMQSSFFREYDERGVQYRCASYNAEGILDLNIVNIKEGRVRERARYFDYRGNLACTTEESTYYGIYIFTTFDAQGNRTERKVIGFLLMSLLSHFWHLREMRRMKKEGTW